MVSKCYDCVFRNDWNECVSSPDCNLGESCSNCNCHYTVYEIEKLLGIE